MVHVLKGASSAPVNIAKSGSDMDGFPSESFGGNNATAAGFCRPFNCSTSSGRSSRARPPLANVYPSASPPPPARGVKSTPVTPKSRAATPFTTTSSPATPQIGGGGGGISRQKATPSPAGTAAGSQSPVGNNLSRNPSPATTFSELDTDSGIQFQFRGWNDF